MTWSRLRSSSLLPPCNFDLELPIFAPVYGSKNEIPALTGLPKPRPSPKLSDGTTCNWADRYKRFTHAAFIAACELRPGQPRVCIRKSIGTNKRQSPIDGCLELASKLGAQRLLKLHKDSRTCFAQLLLLSSLALCRRFLQLADEGYALGLQFLVRGLLLRSNSASANPQDCEARAGRDAFKSRCARSRLRSLPLRPDCTG